MFSKAFLTFIYISTLTAGVISTPIIRRNETLFEIAKGTPECQYPSFLNCGSFTGNSDVPSTELSRVKPEGGDISFSKDTTTTVTKPSYGSEVDIISIDKGHGVVKPEHNLEYKPEQTCHDKCEHLTTIISKPEYRPEHKPDYKPEHKPEYRPEHKPEYQPEHKPEYRPEHKPEYQPEHKPEHVPTIIHKPDHDQPQGGHISFPDKGHSSTIISKPSYRPDGGHISFDNWGGHKSLSGFDNFYGRDNFDGSRHVQVFVPDHQLVCRAVDITIIQQRLVVLQEMAKRIITETICEVEAQTIVFEQWHAGLGGFGRDIRRISGHQVGYDRNVVEHFPKIIDHDGSFKWDNFGFNGRDVGKHTVVVGGSNWDDSRSWKTTGEAYRASRDAFNFIH